MPRRRRYRRWSAEEKRSICREIRAPGVSVAQVARRHALNANLIFKWLKDRRFASADAVEPAPVFLPVEIHGGEVPAAVTVVLRPRLFALDGWIGLLARPRMQQESIVRETLSANSTS
jgi:transposase-like protein